MPRKEPTPPSGPPKEMFLRVRSGGGNGLAAWGSGPRFVLLCIAAATVLALTFGRTGGSSTDVRKGAFERVAQLANGPLRELGPFHARLAVTGGGEMILLDARREACLEAAAHVERLAALSFPPDDQGKAIEPAEGLRRAAGRFVEGVAGCRGEGGAAAPRPDAMPACILQCMRGWSALLGSAERLRKEAAWVGVSVEPIGPPEAAGEQDRGAQDR